MLSFSSRAGLAVRPLAAGLALLLAANAVDAETVHVSGTAQLDAAIALSKPGDVILLATGHYGRIRIDGRSRTGTPVRIEPAPGALPTATEIDITASSGFAVFGITVTSDRHPLVSVSASSDILLGGLRLQGMTNNKDGWDDENTGLRVRSSSRVSVSNTRFADLKVAAFVQRSSGVILADNTIEFVREGINVAAVDRLIIYRNRFQEFTPNYGLGEHPDAIQFWTVNETSGCTNVVIASNYAALSGRKPVQGFFVAGGSDPNQPDGIMHERIEVRHNIYYGSSRNALRLGGVRRGYVHRNTVLASPNADRNTVDPWDKSGRTGGGLQPWIAQFRSLEGRIERNIATLFAEEPGDYSFIDNIKVWDSKSGRGVPLESIFRQRPTSSNPALAEFAVLPGSLADQLGAGAVPPARAGIQTGSLGRVRRAATDYQAQFPKFDSWFSPGF